MLEMEEVGRVNFHPFRQSQIIQERSFDSVAVQFRALALECSWEVRGLWSWCGSQPARVMRIRKLYDALWRSQNALAEGSDILVSFRET